MTEVLLWVKVINREQRICLVWSYQLILRHNFEINPFITVETKAQAAAGDKVKHRLDELDDLEDGSVKETLNLGQKEYVKKIDDLNKSLIAAWDNDQRVKALKIAIQVGHEG